jgi:MraZ protein
VPFQGTFDLSLDDKNRLTLPARHRHEFEEGVVVSLMPEECAAVWRPAEFEAWKTDALAGVPRLSSDYRRLQRFFNANSFPVKLDGAGRVQLPRELLGQLPLKKEVSLVGVDDHFEIWDRETWSRENERLMADVAAIGDRVSGSATS